MPTSDTSNTGVPAISGTHTAGGTGVFGESTGPVPATGVQGASTDGRGVTGESGSAQGVLGFSRRYNGVEGQSESRDASGVYGETPAGWGTAGRTRGRADRSGIWGDHLGDGPGVLGTGATGVFGASARPDGVGALGLDHAGPGAIGVLGTSAPGTGVKGMTFDGTGVVGTCFTSSPDTHAVAVHGIRMGTTGLAGRFDGDVRVTGNLSKASGTFVIDHPLDPANKVLRHSFVESPDMLNIYNGIAVLDASGEALVELPHWFEALNGTYRYALTPLGDPGPDLHVADEIEGNRFRIGGGTPDMRVSWQVTGIRRDPYALHHPVVVEEDKVETQRGRYLHPREHGVPETGGLGVAQG
jgi:hypothetical protein